MLDNAFTQFLPSDLVHSVKPWNYLDEIDSPFSSFASCAQTIDCV